MTYTPGPRVIERDDAESGEIYYAVHGKDYAWVANFDNKEDAVLDAAAPDLLDALRRITAHLVDVMDGPMIRGRGVKFKEGVEGIPTIKAARAAIAKATGDKP